MLGAQRPRGSVRRELAGPDRDRSAVDSSLLTTDDYLDLQLGQLLERISADGLAPGGGSTAAVTVAFAARLVAMVANASRADWPEAGGAVAQAAALSDRAVTLAGADATAWEDALAALRDAENATGEDPRRDFELEKKLGAAAAVPLGIASLAADTVVLASLAAEHGAGTYRADAAAAAALAAGAARAAAHLVQVNLGVRAPDPRLARALESERAADELAGQLLRADG
jgi:methenyltetrahydrofolate cyclohydrolase